MNRTLTQDVAASVPYGAAVITVRALCDEREQLRGAPVLYVDLATAKRLPRRMFRPFMTRVSVSSPAFGGSPAVAPFDMVRIAGVSFDIDRATALRRPMTAVLMEAD